MSSESRINVAALLKIIKLKKKEYFILLGGTAANNVYLTGNLNNPQSGEEKRFYSPTNCDCIWNPFIDADFFFFFFGSFFEAYFFHGIK